MKINKEWIIRKITGLSISFAVVFGLFGASWLGALAIVIIDAGIEGFNRWYNRHLSKKKPKKGLFETTLGSISGTYGACIDAALDLISLIYTAVEENNEREKKGLKTI